MKRSLFRLLLALAIALAVPVQGMAAASAGLCMAFGHHDASAALPDHAAHEHDGAAHEHASGQDNQNSHCGPCVACCAAASIPPVLQVFLAPATPNGAIAPPGIAPPGFLPEQLDRPPLAL